MNKFKLNISNHSCSPVMRRDEADILIQPPISDAEMILRAAMGQRSTNIDVQYPVQTESATIVHVATIGEINERGQALRLFTDRVNLLANGDVELDDLNRDEPFSHEGWAAMRDARHDPSFSVNNPYYNDFGLEDYTPTRKL